MAFRSFRSSNNGIAVSAKKRETAINTFQVLDMELLADETDVINLEPRRESNADEMTRLEEPDQVYDLGDKAVGSFNPPRARPLHFGFVLSYALGACSSSSAGAGYEHVITPIDEDLDENRSNPTFSLAMQYAEVEKVRFASMFVNQSVCTFAVDEFCKIRADFIGTGKHERNVVEEEVTAAQNVTSLTLTRRIEGSTASERLKNVHAVRVLLAKVEITAFADYSSSVPGATKVTAASAHGLTTGDEISIFGTTNYDGDYQVVVLDTDNFYIMIDFVSDDADGSLQSKGAWTDVVFTAASGDAPGVITITAPSGSPGDNTTYKVLYRAAERGTITATSVDVGSVVDITCTAHGLTEGETVRIAGTTSYNGDYEVSVIDADTFRISETNSTSSETGTFTRWMVFPSRVKESPLHVSKITVKVGGRWNGSTFVGGRDMSTQTRTLEWTVNNNMAVEFLPGAGGAYGSRGFRPSREQTIRFNREMRDAILQRIMENNEDVGIYILAEGDAIDGSHNYQAEIIFPKCGVLTAPVSVDGKRLAESGDLIVLQDAAHGSVIVKVKNKVSTFAA